MSSKPKNTMQDSVIESDIFRYATLLSDHIQSNMNELLKIWGMTWLQYQALKVIYDQDTENKGLASKEIGVGLCTRVPDVTRLLDRLAEKGWVIRNRDNQNRRIVRTSLTSIGKALVESVQAPLKELEEQQFNHLDDTQKKALSDLLKLALNDETPYCKEKNKAKNSKK